MKKRMNVTGLLIMLLIIGLVSTFWHNSNAEAKNKTSNHKKSAEQMMVKYSAKDKQNIDPNFRRSRLKQMNVVSEAAKVLNVLPIDIMNEMKNGKTLVQIAQSKGLTKADFLQKLTDYENQIIADAVKTGKITKEHETALKDGQKNRLTKSLTLKAVDVNDHQAMDMGN
ncbi:hypothetical protein [Neobacillus sp. NPDC093127]|uniref:hypothetical protein n=1 Tax=Neobacillus sp. NPDC093127 TaxID=3364296 RepID=UPI0037FE6022